MKSLKTLIKLHSHTLDELHRDMVALENEKAQLEAAMRRLEGQLAKEAELAKTSTDLNRYFGDFAVRIKKRQEQLLVEIQKTEKKIAVLHGEITVEYGELKKYEIALQNAQKREAEEQNRKEIIAMDEVASRQHQRSKNDA